ncbi:uncharacterized protein EI90DRAFT_3151052 [Cantharellus anzutake]|uniref:uncharacterized protein n=1 Tax=Cantharellus anzutake TaxID=1750568 RepID=UPI0019062CAF|nr:uncharacterized protein EI90DRAFT_3151052 [Cantharellus anzutake]KAF8339538.1 hypothetical protein EI90DRAFT_3151052 [Cantharellus anzutake]
MQNLMAGGDLEGIPSVHHFTSEALSKYSVYPLIHSLRKDVENSIDTSLTWGQLNALEVNFTTVRPLVVKYAKLHNPAVVYASLAARSHFLSEAENNIAFAGIIQTRALLCELLAIKLLRRFTRNQIELAAVLTHAWNPLRGAPNVIYEQVKSEMGGDEDDLDDPSSALEAAISTSSKSFCASPLVQNVVNDIWMGRIIFSFPSTHALVKDNWKSREITLYDPGDAPLLDHYRLRVPRYRSILEFINFAALFTLFVLCLSNKDLTKFTTMEIIFIVFVFGFILDEFAASQEYGWTDAISNSPRVNQQVWNGFDLVFSTSPVSAPLVKLFNCPKVALFLTYLGLRVQGITHHDGWYSDLAFDVLSCGACLLFPRLAFFAVSNNVVVLALKGMVADFIYFIGIAAISFSGLLYTLHNLAGDRWPVKSIAWLMVQIWFGNTYLSFTQAESFHPIFGPILMVIFAALSNTLLITILISILSNTFARINEHASEEFLFQYSIATLEGVKADAVFSYLPPFNLAAYVILNILGWWVSPRTLHTANVFMIRVTSFPILLAIACYERYVVPERGLIRSGKGAASAVYNSIQKGVKSVALFDALTGSGSNNLLDAVLKAEYEEDDEGDGIPNEAQTIIEFDGLDEDLPRGQYPPSTSSVGGPLHTPTGRRSRSRRRDMNNAGLLSAPESPLARSFSQRRRPLDDAFYNVPGSAAPGGGDLGATLRRIENLVAERNPIIVHDQIKELGERQTRIEALLLSLTRETRGAA